MFYFRIISDQFHLNKPRFYNQEQTRRMHKSIIIVYLFPHFFSSSRSYLEKSEQEPLVSTLNFDKARVTLWSNAIKQMQQPARVTSLLPPFLP